MQHLLHRLETTLFVDSRSMHGPVGVALRLMRYPAALLRDWLRGELNMRAMSLVYTTLLSLVPLMAFSFSVLKGLGARSDLQLLVYEFFRPMGAAADQLTARVMQFVENVRGGVLGSVGLAFLIYTVITTVQKVEESFNFVWRVDRPRSWARRLSEYVSVMIIGPVFMVAALGLLASAENTALAQWLSQHLGLGAMLASLSHLGPHLLVAAVFTFMYSFIPNTRVRFVPALVGGITAGVLWALVSRLFASVIAYSAQMVAIYTGFAIVLTALIWIYLNWLILLIGAQLCFYVQCPQYLPHGHSPVELNGRMFEHVGLAAMQLIGKDFAAGRRYWTNNHLAEALDVPSVALAPVMASLESAGIVVATEQECWMPARSMETITLVEIMDAIRGARPGRKAVAIAATPTADALMQEIEDAIYERLGARTLQDLIASEKSEGS